MAETIFLFMGAFVFIMNMFIAYYIYKSGKAKSKILATTVFFCGLIILFYLLSIKIKEQFLMSFYRSITLICIDITALCLLHFTKYFLQLDKIVWIQKLQRVLLVLGAADIIISLINPFVEIAYTFELEDTASDFWIMNFKPLGMGHMFYIYVLVALYGAAMIWKSVTVAKMYRRRYISTLMVLVVTVGLNGIFFLVPSMRNLDFSIFLYTPLCISMYRGAYDYAKHGMYEKICEMAINEFGYPLVLFDFEDKLVFYNDDAKGFIRNMTPEYGLSDFIEECHFEKELSAFRDDMIFEWKSMRQDLVTYRVDYHMLYDKKNIMVGKIFVFSLYSSDVDILTGFYTKNFFLERVWKKQEKVSYPVSVAVCDINGLSLINEAYGEDHGNRTIQLLASTLKKYADPDTSFVRLEDANLAMICQNTTQKQMDEKIRMVRAQLQNPSNDPLPVYIQSAISVVENDMQDIDVAIKTAIVSMRQKKMLDSNSLHSSLIDSLNQMQIEMDIGMDKHIRRTSVLCELLGERMGLSDIQQSNLALLCMVHDIGNVGISQEITNKPGRFTQEEWKLVCSHVKKGYRIAKASRELEDIAIYILHHHECWDGSGYPDGLREESIPLLSRIIAVVETYDAMTNDRPYRKAMPQHVAREELKNRGGRQFDPTIVAEFLKLLEDISPLNNIEDISENTPEEMKVLQENKPCGAVGENINSVTYCKYILDGENYIIEIDDAFTALTGYTMEDVKTYNMRQEDLIFEEERPEYLQRVEYLLKQNNEAYLEHRIRRKDGTAGYVFCYGKQYFDSVAKAARSTIVVTDISDSGTMRKKAGRETGMMITLDGKEYSRVDGLTRLMNEDAFRAAVESALSEKNHKYLFAMLDIDDFTGYNGIHGQTAGDILLQDWAEYLRKTFPKDYLLGRMGGDKFGVWVTLSNEVSEKEVHGKVAEMWGISMDYLSSVSGSLWLSAGAALVEEDSYLQAYKEVEFALKLAKKKGKRCYKIFEKERQ